MPPASNQLCPVCDHGFEVFSDHAQCDGCELAVHFKDCSDWHEVTRDGDSHLYIFCLYCHQVDDLEDATYEDDEGYFHPKESDFFDGVDWDDLDDMEDL